MSPNVTAGYDTAPRYLDAARRPRSRPPATRSRRSTSTRRRPPAARRTASRPQIKYPTYLGVLSHFDAVVYYTGDDFIPQDITETDPRRLTSADGQTGSLRDGAVGAQRDARAARLRQRGRQARSSPAATSHQAPTSTSTSLSATGPYKWTPDKLFGFYYPAEQRRRRRPARHGVPALARRSPTTRGRTTSASSAARAASARRRSTASRRSTPVAGRTTAGGLFDRHGADHARRGAGDDPNQNADGTPAAARRSPRCGCATGPASPRNEPLRQERDRGRLRPPGAEPRRRRDHLDADTVTFGFGLEQVDAATRDELVGAHAATCCRRRPTPRRRRSSASSTRPTAPCATPRDPVEVDVTAVRRARRHEGGPSCSPTAQLVGRNSGRSRSSSATSRAPRTWAGRSS